MKTITMLILVLGLNACAVPLTYSDRMSSKNRVAVLNAWPVNISNNGRYTGPLKGISMEVANPTSSNVKVRVVCEYIEDGEYFDESDWTTIEAGMKRTIMVRGMARDGGTNSVKCTIHSRE